MGLTEVCRYTGASPSTVGNWITRDPSFPKPIIVLACGRIWNANDIKKFWEIKGLKVLVQHYKKI